MIVVAYTHSRDDHKTRKDVDINLKIFMVSKETKQAEIRKARSLDS